MSRPVNQTGPGPVYQWAAALGRCLLPPRCLVCGEPGQAGRDVCAACAAALPWNLQACPRCGLPMPEARPRAGPAPDPASADAAQPWPEGWPATWAPSPSRLCGPCQRRPPPLHATRAVFVYAFPLDRLVPRFKFHRDLAAGRLLAGWMAESLADAPRPCALVPVPLHWRRLRRRGYDQARELAAPLARALGLPLRDRLLYRRRDTAPQSELDAAARWRNLRQAFAVRRRTVLPAHVALVDDVMTTGSTLHAAAETLRQAGVRRVDAWVCARAPDPASGVRRGFWPGSSPRANASPHSAAPPSRRPTDRPTDRPAATWPASAGSGVCM